MILSALSWHDLGSCHDYRQTMLVWAGALRKLKSMKLHTNAIFHVYNRGNNGQPIFFNRENQLYFLKKMRTYVSPHANFLAWCLMSNHFHFLIHIPADTDLRKLSKGMQISLSSYTRAVNVQQSRSGSLFEQNTVSKHLGTQPYALTCFHYIHQNPFRAGLVKKLEDWEFSSFRDYAGMRNGTFINQSMAVQLLNLPDSPQKLYEESYAVLDEEIIRSIV